MHKSQPYYVKTNNINTQKRVNTMIYYLFPRYPLKICEQLVANISEYCPIVSYSYSLYLYLSELLDIANIHEDWEQKCDDIHNYHQLPSVANLHMNIGSYEILELYHLMSFTWENFNKIESLHFGVRNSTIDALQYIRRNNDQDVYYNMAINPHSSSDRFFNSTQCKVDLIFCEAYQKKEYENAIELIRQLCFALKTQKRKGTCIIKYGDTFSIVSLQILMILSHYYDKVYIVKPSVCKITSSDKYIVCKNFRYENISEKELSCIYSLYKNVNNCPKNNYVESILRIKIPLFVSSRYEEINSIFSQPRLENLHNVLNNYEKTTTDHIVSTNKDKCIEWCERFPALNIHEDTNNSIVKI